MTPSARLQAVIELVEGYLGTLEAGGPAGDQMVLHYFSKRRYAGSKDRRAVREQFYTIMRQFGLFTWVCQQAGHALDGRKLSLAQLLGKSSDEVDILFSGAKFAPEPLSEEEQQFAETARNILARPDRPVWVERNVPDWLYGRLEERFGDTLPEQLEGLEARAPLDVRVNTTRRSVDKVASAFHGSTPTPFSPFGLRLNDEPNLQQHKLFRDGLVDIQDEGAQLAALACSVQPGMQVLDYCAGAGGKSLAIAQLMDGKGQVFAHDQDPDRLSRLVPRAQRQKLRNIQLINSLEDSSNVFDRVVLDVPCSGTGTWRRNPEQRWRQSPELVAKYVETQAQILVEGAKLVKPGGQLVYITCSILPEEDEQRIMSFLEEHRNYSLAAYDTLPGFTEINLPPSQSLLSECLLMTPATHGTDGFFVAVMDRVN